MSLLDQLCSLCPSKSIVYSSLEEQTRNKLSLYTILPQQPNISISVNQSHQNIPKQSFLSLNTMIATNQQHRTRLTQTTFSSEHNFKRQQGIYKISSFVNKKLWKFYYQFFVICQKISKGKSKGYTPFEQIKDQEIGQHCPQNIRQSNFINGFMILESSLQIIMVKNYNSRFKQLCFNKIAKYSQQVEKVSILFDTINEICIQRNKNSKVKVFQRLMGLINIKKKEEEMLKILKQQEERHSKQQIKKMTLLQQNQVTCCNPFLIKSQAFSGIAISRNIIEQALSVGCHNNLQNIPNRCTKLYENSLPYQIQDINDNINLFIEISKQLNFKFNMSIGTTNANNSMITNKLSDQSNGFQKKNTQKIFDDEQSSIPKSDSQQSESSSKNQILNNLSDQFTQAVNDLYVKLDMQKKENPIQKEHIKSAFNSYVSPINSGKNAKKDQQYTRTAEFVFKKHHIHSILRKNNQQNSIKSNRQDKSAKRQKRCTTNQVQKIQLPEFDIQMQEQSSNSFQFQCQPVKLRQIKNSKRMIQQIAKDFEISPQKISKTVRKDRDRVNFESQNINKSKCSRDISASSRGKKNNNITQKLRGSITPINICSKLHKNKSKSQIKITANPDNFKTQIYSQKKISESNTNLGHKPIISLRLKHRQSNVSKTNIQTAKKNQYETKKSHSQRNHQQQTYKLRKMIQIQMINPIKSATRKSMKSKITTHIFSNVRSKTPKDSSSQIGFQSSSKAQKKRAKLLSLLQ